MVERWRPVVDEEKRVSPCMQPPEQMFGDVLGRRQSDRHLGALRRESLCDLLWHSARTRARDLAVTLEHRAAPAAGALHALEVLLIEPPDESLWRYDPHRSVLGKVRLRSLDALGRSCGDIRGGAGRGNNKATLIVVAADERRYRATYQNSESLLWRDAGCLLMTIHLVSTWLGLGSCILGSLGNKVLSSLADGDLLRPAGMIMVGSLAEPGPAR